MVKKGDLLFVIDPRPYQAELDQAEAELKLARIGVATADLFPRVTFTGSIALQADSFPGLGMGEAILSFLAPKSFGLRLTWDV